MAWMPSWWVATLMVMGSMLCGLPALVGQTQRAVPVREADAVCGRCHREIFESYLKSSMANASGLAEERLLPGRYRDAPSGMEYAVGKDAGGVVLRYAGGRAAETVTGGHDGSGRGLDLGAGVGRSGAGLGEAGAGVGGPEAGLRGSERLEYFLGSGHIGLTYLYEKNGYWLETPVAFYAKLRGYAMKPGAEGMHAMPPALPLNPSCLRCHMSGVARQVAGTDNLYRGLPFQQVGITCESCHGEAREHAATGGRAAVVNPGKLSAERRDSTCIACHLEGETSVERRGRAVLDYQPGDDIRESITYFVTAGEMTTKRAVSEIEQFNVSRCKVATGAAMSCMNCHDPHRTVGEGERAAYYRAKCLGCHAEKGFVAETHFAENRDCTSCHMPKTGSENIAHVAWTDHRIRRRPEAVAVAGVRKGDEAVELVSVLPGPTKVRDLGLAYYNLAVDGVKPARAKAEQLLTVAARADARDATVLRSLGILAEMDGSNARAAEIYRATLKVEPENYVAGTNLGTLLAARGDLEAAAGLWKTAFANNQDVPELGQNLAFAECRLGDKEGARRVLEAVLVYSPGVERARGMLAAIERGTERCGAAGLEMKTLP